MPSSEKDFPQLDQKSADMAQPNETEKNGSSVSDSTSDNSVKPPVTSDMSEKRIFKNILVICTFFFLNFISYGGLAKLQSSLHLEEGMGVITSAIGYASLALSCLLLPKIAIRFIGHKWVMSISLIGYLFWMAANGYAIWATMIPASIICGMCGATLWTTQGAYFAIMAKHYAAKKGQDPRAVTALFFGIFFAFFRTTAVFGSIISSTILDQKPENETQPSNEELSQWCGLNDCPNSGNNNTNLSSPSSTTLWTLVGVYIGIGVIAFVISVVFVDKVPAEWAAAENMNESKDTVKMVVASLLAAFMHMRYLSLLLLIPITVYTGMEQTFREAEYTKSFVSCFLGIWMIGWCLIPSSVVNAVASLLGGKIMKYTGLFPMFCFAFCMDVAYQLTLIFWEPSVDEQLWFYLVPCLNTLADAIWLAQMSALFGILYPTKFAAAFSNYNFWKSCGNIIEFAYSSYLCTSVKLYIMMGFLGVGMALLVVVFAKYMRKASPVEKQALPAASVDGEDNVDDVKEDKQGIFIVGSDNAGFTSDAAVMDGVEVRVFENVFIYRL